MIRKSPKTVICCLWALLSVAPVLAAGNLKCSTCGAVCPSGWTLCQKCKNEADRATREENRRKRLAEQEEAKRRKKAEQEEAKLRKLAEQVAPRPAAPADGASAQTLPPARPAAPSAPAGVSSLPGLFSVKFEDRVEPPRFVKRVAREDGRQTVTYAFVPAKPFRAFPDYTVRPDPVTGQVLSISAHRRFTAQQGLDAKHDSYAEFEACCALLKKKFGLELATVEDSLARKVCVMRFSGADGVPTHVLSVSLSRDMAALVADRTSADPDAVEQNIDLVYDLTITATDRVAALREKMAREREKVAREAADLEAL